MSFDCLTLTACCCCSYQATSKYLQNKNGVVLEGLREHSQQPGDYCVTVLPDGTWSPHPLTLKFKVRRETVVEHWPMTPSAV
jgi:hypothetical protein